MAKQTANEDIAATSGILNPVAHKVPGFKVDATMRQAVAAPRDAGSADADILAFTAAEFTPRRRAAGGRPASAQARRRHAA